MHATQRYLSASVIVITAVLAITACSGGGGSSSPAPVTVVQTTPPPQPAAPPADPAPQPDPQPDPEPVTPAVVPSSATTPRPLNTANGAPLASIDASTGALYYAPYANEGQDNVVNILPDFSHAGYMGGGVALPT